MFRRDLKLFLSSLRTMAVLLVLLALGCLGTVFAISGAEPSGPLRFPIAMCNLDTESRYGTMMLQTASTHDLVTSLIDLKFYDTEAEALRAVDDGAACAVIIPKGFFGSTARGESLPCRMILGTSGEGSRQTIQAYARIGSSILTTGQKIVFTGDYYMMETGQTDEVWDSFNLYMNLSAFEEFQSAHEDYYSRTVIPYTRTNMSRNAHYAILYLAFFLQLLILGYYRLYQTDVTRSRQLMLRSAGITTAGFLQWKCLLPFLFSILLIGSLYPVAAHFLPMQLTFDSIAYALLALGFTAALGAFLSIAFSRISGAVLFALHIAGLFFCGGIVPYARLHPLIPLIGEFTPLGVIYHLLGPIAGGTCRWTAFAAGAFYLVIALFLCRYRLQNVLSGRTSTAPFSIHRSGGPLFLKLTVRTALAGALLLFVITWLSFGYSKVSTMNGCAICTEDTSPEAQELLDSLDPVRFHRVATREEALRAVQSGAADCGMVLRSGLAARLQSVDLDGCMELLVSPLSQMERSLTMETTSRLYDLVAPYLTQKAIADYGFELSMEQVQTYFRRAEAEITPLSFTITDVAGTDVDAVPSTELPLGLIAIAGFIIYGFLVVGRIRPKLRNVRGRFSAKGWLVHAAMPRILPTGLLLCLAALLGAIPGSLTAGVACLPILVSIFLYFLALSILFLFMPMLPFSDHVLICLIALEAAISLVLCPLFWDIASVLPLTRYLRWFSIPYWIYTVGL